jgi:SnoaL-like protein
VNVVKRSSHYQTEREAQNLIARDEIRATIIRFATSLDLKEWRQCRSCFIDQIHTDYSALRGDPPAIVNADDFVELRRRALSDLLTHHVSTNHSIELNGDEAICVSGMVIYRRVPGDADGTAFDTHCIYTHTLVRTPDGWKISKVKQQILWNTGDARIHAGAKGPSPVDAKGQAQADAKSRSRGRK